MERGASWTFRLYDWCVFRPRARQRTIIKAVARGLGRDDAEVIDLTRPEVRAQPLTTGPGDLLLVAAPVYGGRLPLPVCAWLETLEANGTPTVCLVVYGNREFEDALLELTDMVKARGGVPVAGGAFVAEHSFSSDDAPVAVGRPDAADLETAEDLGRRVAKVVAALASADQAPDLIVPGDRPYKERKPRPPVDFIAVNDDCVQCGLCAKACPVDAIDPEDSAQMDIVKCIRCCACIKVCPQQARSKKPSWVVDAANWLAANCAARKEPAFFI